MTATHLGEKSKSHGSETVIKRALAAKSRRVQKALKRIIAEVGVSLSKDIEYFQ